MKAFVTGATGFVGGRLVGRLRDRGDEVVALVRSPSKAKPLVELGCELVEGDLLAEQAIKDGVAGCDAVFHVAADYRSGIPKRDQGSMHEANVRGTEVVLDAAIEAGVAKILYVSTVGYFGNTRGEVVDETFTRTDFDWLSAYDETKYLAHQLAKERIEDGAPIVIVQPGGIYGPGDNSDLRTLINKIRTGKLPFLPMGAVGFNFVHVDDVVDGILLAFEKGKVGQSYVLGAEITTMRGLVDVICDLEGRKSPGSMPTWVLKAISPAGPVVGKVMGIPPNLKEMIKSADGVTYWAKADKAVKELGFQPRDLKTGMRQTLAEI